MLSIFSRLCLRSRRSNKIFLYRLRQEFEEHSLLTTISYNCVCGCCRSTSLCQIRHIW
ncbi:unnamed protein product [Debaryomyces tyrocola]|nr:unnamed protein product [Debaryomyces tyrocola]